MIFATAPWTAGRVQVPPAQLSGQALHIASYLSSALAPREKRVSSDKEFQEICGAEESGDERTCILALKGPLYSETQQDTMGGLVKYFHKSTLAIVSVDTKVRWLSVESSSIMSRKFAMRLYAIRNGTHYMSLAASPTPGNALEFVQNAINVRLMLIHIYVCLYVIYFYVCLYVCCHNMFVYTYVVIIYICNFFPLCSMYIYICATVLRPRRQTLLLRPV